MATITKISDADDVFLGFELDGVFYGLPKNVRSDSQALRSLANSVFAALMSTPTQSYRETRMNQQTVILNGQLHDQMNKLKMMKMENQALKNTIAQAEQGLDMVMEKFDLFTVESNDLKQIQKLLKKAGSDD